MNNSIIIKLCFATAISSMVIHCIGCSSYVTKKQYEQKLIDLVDPGFSEIKKAEMFTGKDRYILSKIKVFGDSDSLDIFETTERSDLLGEQRIINGITKAVHLDPYGDDKVSFISATGIYEIEADGNFSKNVHVKYERNGKQFNAEIKVYDWSGNINEWLSGHEEQKFFSNQDNTKFIIAASKEMGTIKKFIVMTFNKV